MSDTDADTGLTVQADADNLEARTLDILFDLRKDTTTLYRGLLATDYTSPDNDVYQSFVAALTTEISFLRPQLRKSEYLTDHHLGTVTHKDGKFRFEGLQDVIQHSSGVKVTILEESRGRGSNTRPVNRTIPIPARILKNAYAALTDWYADVGLSIDVRPDDADKWDV
jgi:hypothetical protein